MPDFILPEKKYQLIYADPPWSYSAWSNHKTHITNQYQTMTYKQLRELSVSNIAEKDSILLMWATFPNLPQAIDLIDAWGFKYKTMAFTWVKKNKKSNSWFWGLGHYTRSNSEICLLGKRGKGLKRLDNGVHSILDDKIREHSRKPDEAHKRINRLFGSDITRLEMFARERHIGWDLWGNETDKFSDNINIIPQLPGV